MTTTATATGQMAFDINPTGEPAFDFTPRITELVFLTRKDGRTNLWAAFTPQGDDGDTVFHQAGTGVRVMRPALSGMFSQDMATGMVSDLIAKGWTVA